MIIRILEYVFILSIVTTFSLVLIGAFLIGLIMCAGGWYHLWLAIPWGFLCWLMTMVNKALLRVVTPKDPY